MNKTKFKEDLMLTIENLAKNYANLMEPYINKPAHELQTNRVEISWDKFYNSYVKGAEDAIKIMLRNYEFKENTSSEYCQCEKPDRESGYTYCHRCHKHVSDAKMRFIINNNETFNIPAIDEPNNSFKAFKEKVIWDTYYRHLYARATSEEDKELILKRMREGWSFLTPNENNGEINTKIINDSNVINGDNIVNDYINNDINANIRKKIDEAYKSINKEFCNLPMMLDNKTTRYIIVGKLKNYIGAPLSFQTIFTIKCDEENNPSNIIDMNILIVDVSWKDKSATIEKRLVFGDDKQIKAYYYTRFC